MVDMLDMVDVTVESEFVVSCYNSLAQNNTGVTIPELIKLVSEQLKAGKVRNQSDLTKKMISKISSDKRASVAFWRELIGLLSQHGYLIERRKFTQYWNKTSKSLCDTSHLEVSLSDVLGQSLLVSASRHDSDTPVVAAEVVSGAAGATTGAGAGATVGRAVGGPATEAAPHNPVIPPVVKFFKFLCMR